MSSTGVAGRTTSVGILGVGSSNGSRAGSAKGSAPIIGCTWTGLRDKVDELVKSEASELRFMGLSKNGTGFFRGLVTINPGLDVAPVITGTPPSRNVGDGIDIGGRDPLAILPMLEDGVETECKDEVGDGNGSGVAERNVRRS